MKKFLAIILIVLTLFSVSALAAETTFAGSFTLFDFGSESKVDDKYKVGLLEVWDLINCERTETEDSWILVCTENRPKEYQGTTQFNYNEDYVPQISIFNLYDLTFGEVKFNNGWGTYKPVDYDTAEQKWIYGDEWVGKNQFMKLRVKNESNNDRMALYVLDTWEGSSFRMHIFEVSANDTEFQTYIIDMAIAGQRGTTLLYPNLSAFAKDGWCPWIGKDATNIDFLLFGSWSNENWISDTSDITYLQIEKGATVEIDYAIFAPTPEMAAQYKSYDEENNASTTESVVETTTIESVVETTTDAVVDQTTVPQDNSTTTIDGNTDTDKEGGFPVWIIIVIVVVIGGGVAAFFVFKKK